MCVYLYITTFYTNTFALTSLLKGSFKEYFWKTVRLDKKKYHFNYQKYLQQKI